VGRAAAHPGPGLDITLVAPRARKPLHEEHLLGRVIIAIGLVRATPYSRAISARSASSSTPSVSSSSFAAWCRSTARISRNRRLLHLPRRGGDPLVSFESWASLARATSPTHHRHLRSRRVYPFGVCVRGLPDVFDIKRKRWIRPELQPADVVAEQVMRCPSGALQFVRKQKTD